MDSTEDSLSPRVEAALQDPNLHTDARLRLRRQLIALLHEHGRTVEPRGEPGRSKPPPAADVPALVDAALSDPNLRTDEQLALSRQVQRLLKAAAGRT